MQIELTAPACLFLGLTHIDGQLCQLGITLQYPPVQLMAQSSVGLTITGGRADLAHEQAARFFEHYQLTPQGEVEIELAIPSFMGLGSRAMLGLSVAEVLAAIHQVSSPIDELATAVGLIADEALEQHAFAAGGLLAVNEHGALLKRQSIAHAAEDDDWAFVFVLPPMPADVPESLEAERRRALFAATEHLDTQNESVAETVWSAVDRDDIIEFAHALASIEASNTAALAASGHPHTLSPNEQAILEVMRANGAVHCGRALTGLALYGMIKGGGPSRVLRRALTEHLGFFGSTVMASVCDNRGSQMQTSP